MKWVVPVACKGEVLQPKAIGRKVLWNVSILPHNYMVS